MSNMKFCLAVFIILYESCVTTATLQVFINGQSSNGTPLCPNDNVTFVCDLQLSAFRWTVGSNLTGVDGLVTTPFDGSLATVTRGVYTLTAQGMFPNITSTLQVTIFSQLNGSVVTCADANPNNNQTAVIIVYANPSAPVIRGISFETDQNDVVFTAIVDPPSENPECVTSYIVTLNTATIEVPSIHPPGRQIITINTAEMVGTLPCVTKYNYTIKPSNGNKESEVVGSFDYQRQPSAPHISTIYSSFHNNDLMFNLAIDPPVRNAECVTTYKVSVISDNQVFIVQVPVNVSTNTFVSISEANVINFNPCLKNYSFQVQVSNSAEMSNVVEGHFNFSGYKSLSCISQDAFDLRWSIPTEIANCIAYLQYTLHYSKTSGFINANATTLPLDSVNISTTCNVDIITITPIFYVRSDPIFTASAMGLISKGEICSMTTDEQKIRMQFCKYEPYIGSLVGIIIIAALVVLMVMSINVIVIWKNIKLHRSTCVCKENATKGTRGNYVNSNHVKESAVSKDYCDVSMVECQAYGAVLQSKVSSTTKQTQPLTSASVYENI